MNEVTMQFIIAIIEMAFKYGVPVTLDIIGAWNVKNPTLEDIRALKDRVPHPDTYK